MQQFTKERKGTGDVQGNTGVQTITSLTVDSHSGGLLHGLPPLTETQLVTDMAKVSGFVLDDKLGPVVKEQASVQLNTHSDEASSSKEQVFLLPSSVQPAATFSTHLPKYNSDFSSENVEDCEAGLDAMDVSLRFVFIVCTCMYIHGTESIPQTTVYKKHNALSVWSLSHHLC